jgi:hypothetical protein
MFRVTVFSLYLHDGYMWITEELLTVTVYSDNPEAALLKVRTMTGLHCELAKED